MYRRRWRSRTEKGSRKKVVFFVLVICFLFSVQSFVYIEKKLRPPLMHVAKIRVKQVATQSINSAITERIARGTNFDKLIEWKTDYAGKINGFMLNYVEHMKITSETVQVVQHTLNQMQEVPEHIPLGQALDSAIIASFGPHIPIRLVPQGAVKVDLSTRQQNAGINMILVEVYVRIIAEVAIIIPFDSEAEIVETEIPISYVLVVGDVPMYYFDGKGAPTGNSMPPPPNISIPQIKGTETRAEQQMKEEPLNKN